MHALLRDGQLLVLRSTVYPGVTALVEKLVSELGHDIDVAFCPERIAEHRAMEELYTLPQIVASRSPRGRARVSYFHTYAYDLLAQNERIIASSCDAAITAFDSGNGRLTKVTYLSSSMVFESTTRWPSVEGDERTVPPPLSSHGFQKLAVEYFARAAWDQYRLPYTILRPFYCVGIGESRALGDVEIASGNVKLAMSHVVPDLVQKVLKGQDPLHVLGDGNQVRHYTYGGDLARGIVDAVEHPAALNEDFNLSTPAGHSVSELAEVIWRKINGPDVPLRLVHEQPFEHDVQKRVPPTEKARQVLGFEAATTLEDMLDEVILWIAEAARNGTI